MSGKENISLLQIFQMFPDEQTAESWFEQARWGDNIRCAFCETENVSKVKHPSMKYRCRECRKHFSARTNSLMHGSKITYQLWAIAIHHISSRPKGISSIQLAKDLGVQQRTAWYIGHRVRAALDIEKQKFNGEVEVDEMFVGGLEKNKHSNKKLRAGSGTVGKMPVVGILHRESNQVIAEVVDDTEKSTLQPFVLRHTTPDAIVYTDESGSYWGLRRRHGTVQHSRGEYVNEQISTNGIESFWAVFKRAFKGTYHHMSRKHLDRYVAEFVGKHNNRPLGSVDRMEATVKGVDKKQMRYREITA